MNKFIISLTITGLVLGFSAGAQTTVGGPAIKIAPLKNGLIATSSKPRLIEQKQVILNQIKAERENFQNKIQSLKQEFQTKREVEKEELKTKLQIIKDEVKKVAVQKLDQNMNDLNTKFVDKFTKALTNYDEQLSKLVERVSATSTTQDLSAFNQAVDSARIAIASAKTAVEAQAKKTYAVAVSTENNLKIDISAVRTQLNNDLKAVKDLAQAAHNAVVKTLIELNKVRRLLKGAATTTVSQ